MIAAIRRELRRRLGVLPHLLPDPFDLAVYKYASRRPKSELAGLQRERRLARGLGTPPMVRSGPFVGMRYVFSSRGSTLLPKLLGCYEAELHDVVEGICSYGPDRVIDVGAAEGYYVVGFARRLPGVQVIGFESDAAGRYLMGRLARLNGVGARVVTAGTCTTASLRKALDGARRPALVCDIEGGEVELLDPGPIPALGRSAILVETHEGVQPEVIAILRGRFETTHAIRFVPVRPRVPSDLTIDWPGDERERAAFLDEKRANSTGWLWMTPR
jgi:hypothetical protein